MNTESNLKKVSNVGYLFLIPKLPLEIYLKSAMIVYERL
jgi:hypothetical protein